MPSRMYSRKGIKHVSYHRRQPEDTFKHFIVTMFNAGLYTSVRLNKNGVRLGGIAEEWMAHRMLLFEQICVPSMCAQTCQNFTWLIICDPATPPATVEHITAQHPNVRIIYSINALFGYVQNECIVNGAIHAITSRCDNDDALNTNYVQLVQRVMPDAGRALISFPRFEIWHRQSGTCSNMAGVSNMFISMVEPVTERPHTVYKIAHGYMAKHYPTAIIDQGIPMALCVVHEHNIYNKMKGAVKREPDWAQYGIIGSLLPGLIKSDYARGKAQEGE